MLKTTQLRPNRSFTSIFDGMISAWFFVAGVFVPIASIKHVNDYGETMDIIAQHWAVVALCVVEG